MSLRKERPRLVPARPGAEDRLYSWKDIAVYLRREQRTVQRWERTEGLPVHRIQHGKAGSVYASKTELDAWVAQHSSESSRPATPAPRRPIWLGALTGMVLVAAAVAYRLSGG